MSDCFKFDLEDVKVAGFGKNFSGLGGDRSFIIYISEDCAIMLAEHGCTVKWTKEYIDDEGGITHPRPFIKVRIKFKKRSGEMVKYPPNVYMVTRNKRPVLLRETDIDELDRIFIEQVSGSFSTWDYSGNMGSGKSIYVNELWVEVRSTSKFADKYAYSEHPVDSDEEYPYK